MENDCFKTSITEITNIIKENSGRNNIEDCMNKFENILDNSLQGITPSTYLDGKDGLLYKKTRRVKRVKKNQSWYNNDCRILKRNLDYLCKSLNRNPSNQLLRNTYYKNRKEYKKIVKHHKQKFERDIILELENHTKKGKEFWNHFKRSSRNTPESLPSANDIQNHFISLYTTTSNVKPNFERQTSSNVDNKFEITYRITKEDIKLQIDKCKLKGTRGS